MGVKYMPTATPTPLGKSAAAHSGADRRRADASTRSAAADSARQQPWQAHDGLLAPRHAAPGATAPGPALPSISLRSAAVSAVLLRSLPPVAATGSASSSVQPLRRCCLCRTCAARAAAAARPRTSCTSGSAAAAAAATAQNGPTFSGSRPPLTSLAMSSQICAVGAGSTGPGTCHAVVYRRYAATLSGTDAADPSSIPASCAPGDTPSRCAVLKSCTAQGSQVSNAALCVVHVHVRCRMTRVRGQRPCAHAHMHVQEHDC